MTNNLVAKFSRQDLKDLNTPASASIIDVQHITSYNWIEAPRATPTIAVPGKSPLEPLFRALYVTRPSFDIASIDVVTDRNNVRKLLSFVNHRWSSYKRVDFTIHVEIANNTAIFCRDETKTEEYIGPNEFRGYGHSFEKKCTRPQVITSTGHHRIISYSFGGLKFLVRYETDGYVGDSSTQPGIQPAGSQASKVDDLSSILDSLSLSAESGDPRKTYPTSSKLVVRKEGQAVPLNSTLEVKTRVAHRPLAFEDVVSQLWVSQTPKLVRAYHTRGVFAVPKVEDVAVQTKAWEDQNQKDLRMLAGLIGRIRDIVKDNGGRAILKYDAIGDKLVFHKLAGKQMLPKDLYAKWEGKDSGEQVIGQDAKIAKQSVKEAESAVSGKPLRTAGMEGNVVVGA